MTTYKNEGFLYIAHNAHDKVGPHNEHDLPFITGHIIDSHDNLICPGEIPTLINPEYEDIGDNIKFYTPLLRGTHIRIYWYNGEWNISTTTEIYPTLDKNTNIIIKQQINFDLLEETKVYYAVITASPVAQASTAVAQASTAVAQASTAVAEESKCILTYTTEKSAPQLHLPELDHDLAFTHHIPLLPYNLTAYETEQMMKTLKMEHDYGIVLYNQDGSQIEIWSKYYHIIKSMEKPDHVSIYNYYFDCLNHYAIDESDEFEIIMIHLLCDINEFTIYFPEHKEKCDTFTRKIEEYITTDTTNEEKIKKLKYLLSLDIDYAISLISPMPSRRNSVV